MKLGHQKLVLLQRPQFCDNNVYCKNDFCNRSIDVSLLMSRPLVPLVHKISYKSGLRCPIIVSHTLHSILKIPDKKRKSGQSLRGQTLPTKRFNQLSPAKIPLPLSCPGLQSDRRNHFQQSTRHTKRQHVTKINYF